MGKRPESHRKRQPGEVTHGGYALFRLLGRGEVSVKAWLGRLIRDVREGYALSCGYATFESVPRGMQTAIKQAVVRQRAPAFRRWGGATDDGAPGHVHGVAQAVASEPDPHERTVRRERVQAYGL